MDLKGIKTGYLLGISLLLSSVFYFFASNWQGFDRITKVCLSIALIFLFYGLHLLFRKVMKHQQFLSDWMLVATSIIFGLSVALIGQIYNSHADSYLLFLVWLFPVLLFALATKYEPFYVLSYILLHITIYFYLTPSTYLANWNEHQYFWILFGVMLGNAVIFYVSEQFLHSKTLKYGSFIVFHYIFVFLTVIAGLPLYKFISNGLYIIVLGIGYYYWSKKKENRVLLTILGVYTIIYLVIKSFRWIAPYFGEWILFFFLFLAAALVFLSIIAVKFMNETPFFRFIKSLLTIAVTLIATLFATSAIFGLFFLLFPGSSIDLLFFFAIIVLILPAVITKWPIQIKYTLLATGFLIAVGIVLFHQLLFYRLLLFALVSFAIYIMKQKGIRVFLYLLLNLVFAAVLFEWFWIHTVTISLLVLNGGYYFLQKKENATRYTALILAFLSLITLTMMEVSDWLSIVYNLSFFLITTTCLFVLNRNTRRWEWTTSFIFWFLFIAYKYYEFLWKLIHKSLLLLFLGLVILGVTIYFERKLAKTEKKGPRFKQKWAFILLLVCLQVGFVSYQSITNEMLLKEGTLIKVKLEPVDPRSLLQGDYVTLRYDISTIPDLDNSSMSNEKVKVVLRENEDNIYGYAGYVYADGEWNRPYKKQLGDVIINGKTNRPGEVIYGTESFFVPEGEGIELQDNAEIAYLRVGKKGNALLQNVE
ncbi:GDYXXLXY domain-containing protein [Bacillus sp. J14TS2]|uniref:GDYXXLXY domain-containing protein n=1 Tax=Bacillus sp. J14TS2 TaxID=2807188 RepID=UPI001BB43906|nr:GDYXXLXY domain-containing protein [Bacillus sp. J14TS2]